MTWWHGINPADMQKGTRVVPRKQKASVIELVVDKSMNNKSSNINKISVFGKGKYCFYEPKRSSS